MSTYIYSTFVITYCIFDQNLKIYSDEHVLKFPENIVKLFRFYQDPLYPSFLLVSLPYLCFHLVILVHRSDLISHIGSMYLPFSLCLVLVF